MKQHVAFHRDYYLAAFFANREKPQHEWLREVYLDESYTHQHCHKFDDSIWNPNDEQDLQVAKLKHEGNLHCFLCAMQGPDPREADVEERRSLKQPFHKTEEELCQAPCGLLPTAEESTQRRLLQGFQLD